MATRKRALEADEPAAPEAEVIRQSGDGAALEAGRPRAPAAGPGAPAQEAAPEAELAPAGDGAAALQAADAGPGAAESEVFVAAQPSAKRHRFSDAGGERFSLRGNSADAPAANPALFRQHPLREEQRRTLAWMLEREARPSGFKGGLLADKMGYGKTATVIGLVSQDPAAAAAAGGAGEQVAWRDSYMLSSSTLILCPPHLVQQWEGEFVKFLAEEVQIWRPTPEPPAAQKQTFRLPPFKLPSSSSMPLGVKTSWPQPLLVEEVSGFMLSVNQARAAAADQLKLGDEILGIKIQFPRGHTREGRDAEGHVVPFSWWVINNAGEIRHFVKGKETCYWAGEKHPRAQYPRGSTAIFTVRREREGRFELVRGQGPLHVLAVATSKEHMRLQQGDLLGRFAAVIFSTGVLKSAPYQNKVNHVLHKHLENKGRLLGRWAQRMALLRDVVQTWRQEPSRATRALQRRCPLLEAVWWQRLVLDEFHEAAAWTNPVRQIVKALGAEFRWGLTGTPPVGSTEEVLETAHLLRYPALEPAASFLRDADFPTRLKAQAWLEKPENRSGLQSDARRFLEDFVRQNTSTLLESIGVVEHEELVDHTREERLIYRQACHDNDVFNLELGYEGVSLGARAALLQRCAHFSLSMSEEDAAAAVRRLGDAKRERIRLVEDQLRIEALRAAELGAWEHARGALLEALPTRHPDATRFLRELAELREPVGACGDGPAAAARALELSVETHDQQGHLRVRPEVRLRQPLRDSECYTNPQRRQVIVHEVARKAGHKEAQSILAGSAACLQACPGGRGALKAALRTALGEGLVAVARLLDAALRSRDFFDWQLQGLSAQGEHARHECSICMEGAGSLGSLAILPCAHVFHTACIWAAVRSKPACPECRAPVTCHQVGSVIMELAPPDSKAAASARAEALPPPQLRAHGSKLSAVACRLLRIRSDDQTAKAIVFVQWASLETKVAEALRDHGIACARVPWGGAGARMAAATLRSFQEEAGGDSPFVLLLSLEKAASGANLTAASHVLFVHPMNADSLDTAVAYERQALGRVRRVGQVRSEVHVWRFVARHTVEEHIHRLHRGAPEVAAAASGGAASSGAASPERA